MRDRTTDSYVVVYSDDNNDLYDSSFAYYEEAIAFIESSDNKCILIKVEGLCRSARISVEYHT